MTARDDFDRHLAAWLTADAPTSEPEHLLGEVLARTARTRRRPAWRIPERWIPMSVDHFPGRDVPTRALADRRARRPARPRAGRGGGAARRLAGHRPLPPPFGPADNGRIVYAESGELWSRATLDGRAHQRSWRPRQDHGVLRTRRRAGRLPAGRRGGRQRPVGREPGRLGCAPPRRAVPPRRLVRVVAGWRR